MESGGCLGHHINSQADSEADRNVEVSRTPIAPSLASSRQAVRYIASVECRWLAQFVIDSETGHGTQWGQPLTLRASKRSAYG